MSEYTKEQLIENGKATQFGQPGGPVPAEAAKGKNPHSIRNAVRRVGAMDVDQALAISSAPNRGKLSMVEAVALAKFKQALAGNVMAMHQLENSIDGKLVDKQVSAETTLEELVLGSYDHEDEYAENAKEQGADSPVET